MPDGELLEVIFAGYNDWLAEFCRYDPKRLRGIAMIHVEDVPGAIAEPFFLDRLDHTYTQRARRPWWHRFKEGLPSEFFRRNVFLSFQETRWVSASATRSASTR